jgi:hypothetical protein
MKNFTNVLRGTIVAAVIGGASLGFAGHAVAEVYGDPEGSSNFWVQQTLDDCSLMSTADVIGQLTGYQPSENEIVALAGATPSKHHDGAIYLPPANPDDPDSGNGTDSQDLPILLAHYGVNSVYTDDDVAKQGGAPTGMEALKNELGAGHKVIAGVNAQTIWNEDGDRSTANHDLVVNAVDTDLGIVFLNDSGTDDGQDEQVPIATFETAWATSGHDMVITR